jgi:hypothetical protein
MVMGEEEPERCAVCDKALSFRDQWSLVLQNPENFREHAKIINLCTEDRPAIQRAMNEAVEREVRARRGMYGLR